MNKEDIRSLTRISRSLWGDSEQSTAISEDTLTNISLLQLNDEQTIERASKALIEIAEKNPPSLLKLNHPFYRLAPVERFLLTASQIEKWSYRKIARTLGLEKNLVEPWLWSIRLKLCFQEAGCELDYPRGPGTLSPSCPEYHPNEPWTQRMMDDELGNQERFYIQNHLINCDKCRKALDQTRNLIFKIESLIPVSQTSAELESATQKIFKAWKEGESTFRPIKTETRTTLLRFASQPKVQFLLAALAVFVFFWLTKNP